MSRIRIGTRGSLLARWQAEHVQGRLEALGHEISLVVIRALGQVDRGGTCEDQGKQG